jgi:cell division protein FtsW
MKQERNHIDILLLLAVLTLMVMSLGVVYSAGSTWAEIRMHGSGTLLVMHAAKVLIGLLAMFVLMHIDYRVYKKVTKALLVSAVVLLVVTLALGGEVKGATRWLRLGGFGFQPSEFAKYALLFHLATMVSVKRELVRDFRVGFLPMVIWIGAVTGLVLLQPNFSTGAMIFGISLAVLFIGQVRLVHIGLALGTLIPLLGIYMVSAEYRMRRILAFLSGGDSAASTNYQLWQGIIGFGNGGIMGLGPGGSRQRELFLPESYGDFVFSIVGEEYGLIGTVVVVMLFLTILLRGLKIAKSARDDFGRVLAFGITFTVSLYALINAGVTLGILPTTGLPMPFVSYGGSSMVFSAGAIGVLLNISSQTDLHPRLITAPDGIRPVEPMRLPAEGRA